MRNYVRKSHRQSWSMDRLQAAVDDIKANKLSLRKAAAVYGVPHVTIHRYLLGLVQKPSRLGRFQTVLDDKFEQELATYVTHMQQRFYHRPLKIRTDDGHAWVRELGSIAVLLVLV